MGKTLEQRVAELEKQINEIVGSKVVRISKSLEVGDTFELAGLTWTILDITDKGYMCLAGRMNESMIFDSDRNNWQESDLRNYLNVDFYKKLSAAIGDGNIISFERNLLSLDGQTEYGVCEDKVSLLTVDEYRKYRSMVPNTDEYWWWLITPWSTPCNEYETTVTVVSSSGYIGRYSCYRNCGVRPFCIFSSTIFESEE